MIQTTGGNATDKLVTRVGYGDFPANSGNGWTVFIQFKYNAAITGGKYASILSLFAGLTDFTNPYVSIRSAVSTDNVLVKAFNGTTTVTSAVQAIVTSAQNWIGISYTPTTHTIGVIVNNVFVGDFVINLSSVTFDTLNILGDGSATTKSAISAAYCRGWNRVLMASELTTEATTVIASTATGLLWDCPLQAGIDLTAHNNTINQLTATGIVTTDTTDPLISVIPGPVTNTLPGTATAITLNSAFFQNVNTAGVATTVWYKCDCTEDATWGICGFGDLTAYKPHMVPYEGLANANSGTNLLNITGSNNLPIQFPVTSGNTYYFSAIRNGAVAASTLQISLLRALDLSIVQGNIIINDDTADFPCAVVDNSADYIIRKFVQPFASGEDGDCIPSTGLYIFNDLTFNLKNYDKDLSFTSSEVTSTHSIHVRTCLTPNKIYYGINQNPPLVGSIDSTGALTVPTFTLTSNTSLVCLAANNAETVLYFANAAVANEIKVWDLVNNIALPDLVTGLSGHELFDILVMSDNTLIVCYTKSSATKDVVVKQFDSVGTLLNTYNFGSTNNISTGPRLAYALDDPNSFWIWLHQANGITKYENIKVSDGSVITTRTDIEFENGTSSEASSNTPIRFGVSFSCPIVIARLGSIISNAASGLYNLSGTGGTERLFHDRLWIDASAGTDESLAIPNPFTESYLAGDE